ncbi:nuclear transport factor 2 family protein [Streptomyces sp. NA04227]|uniref:nuclear transport factor 2 family protein n=1 Tax=Streptomyces sp. NA04227 TaxID=2742136 RepID=UPI00159239CC|nr:nuclear transport factor 2 family protein [Streptomyces sp. NA04227]QKW06187.1 nuclear transport factor 2 family protein [Streptomyces sp. NA04227]
MNLTTSIHTGAIERYIAAWNTRDAEARAKAVAAAWAEDGTYTDPLTEARGHEQLVAAIGATQAQFPGYEFKVTGEPDGHHDLVRFTWDLVSVADGSSPAAGFDVITLAEDGRITSVAGFFDRLPGA